MTDHPRSPDPTDDGAPRVTVRDGVLRADSLYVAPWPPGSDPVRWTPIGELADDALEYEANP